MPTHCDNHDVVSPAAHEWLLTNRLGGFAMGGSVGENTRRYHGLFTVARTPPTSRTLALHSMVETLVVDGQTHHLSVHEFRTSPLENDEFRHIEPDSSALPAQMRWIYRVNDRRIDKTLALESMEPAAKLSYRVHRAPRPAQLYLRPLTPLRRFHDLAHHTDDPPLVEQSSPHAVTLRRGSLTLTLEAISAAHVTWWDDAEWWKNFAYREDRSRGQEWREDVWSPGVFQIDVPAGGDTEVLLRATATAAAGRRSSTPPPRTDRESTVRPAQGVVGRLQRAADQFVVLRRDHEQWHTSIIAGYPWFADWGRDAMISLPGLLLIAGRLDEARSTLLTFARHVRRGLTPNRFDDEVGEPHYNTADASLWFVHAVGQYVAVAGDENPRELLDACRDIIDCHRRGTDYQIRLDDDGLITAGNEHTQLTWMDARRDGVVFTPRNGKAIEVNALWYNALLTLADLTHETDERLELSALAERGAESIRAKFWWAERGCCHDVLTPNGVGDWIPDGKLRPNQIFAVSLPHSPLTLEQQRSVVRVVREQLLTPVGLRTLAADHEDYRPRYEGDMTARDGAYHQGTVWPWLIGPYGEAVLRSDQFSDHAKTHVREVTAPLLDELESGCLGQLAEIYDAEAPHRAHGCPAQAWSVAELLRLLDLAGLLEPVPAGGSSPYQGRSTVAR